VPIAYTQVGGDEEELRGEEVRRPMITSGGQERGLKVRSLPTGKGSDDHPLSWGFCKEREPCRQKLKKRRTFDASTTIELQITCGGTVTQMNRRRTMEANCGNAGPDGWEEEKGTTRGEHEKRQGDSKTPSPWSGRIGRKKPSSPKVSILTNVPRVRHSSTLRMTESSTGLEKRTVGFISRILESKRQKEGGITCRKDKRTTKKGTPSRQGN